MDPSILDIIIILLFLPLLASYLGELFRQWRKWGIIRSMQDKRGSLVIPLVHPQRPSMFLGMLAPNYISIRDAQRILGMIRDAPPEKPIDIILHTTGGMVVASQQIASALAAHKGKVTAFVPYFSFSGGTLIALAADEIVMDRQALLGRVDPQIFGASAISISQAVSRKDPDRVSDIALVLSDTAEKALSQVKEILADLLRLKGYAGKEIEAISEELVLGKYTHDYPITFKKATELGLKVNEGVPRDIYRLPETYERR